MVGGAFGLFREFREFPGFPGKILGFFSLIGLLRESREFPGFSGKILGFSSLFRKFGEISGNSRKTVGVFHRLREFLNTYCKNSFMVEGGFGRVRDFREFPGFSGKILGFFSPICLFREFREFPGYSGKTLGFFGPFRKF